MEPVIKTKLELTLKLKDLEATLRMRGIAVTQANLKRLISFIRRASILASSEFFEDIPVDQKMLRMYGFTFAKEELENGAINAS